MFELMPNVCDNLHPWIVILVIRTVIIVSETVAIVSLTKITVRITKITISLTGDCHTYLAEAQQC